MKILVITRNAWDDTNSIGNTMSNFFGCLDNAEFANVYFRSAYPNNSICKNYFRVTETEILKKWFSLSDAGEVFCAEDKKESAVKSSKTTNEKTIIRLIHKYGLDLAYKISDYLWYSKKWINRNLDNFIKDFAPDVIFTFVKSAPQYYLTVKYLRENFNVPLFTWIADDEYTGLVKNDRSKEIENLRYLLNESSVVFGCSEEICDYYNSVFGCNASPFYKGCELSEQVKHEVNDSIKIVYAGNLLYGRLEIIKKFAESLEKYSFDTNKVELKIYSNTPISLEDEKYFEQKKRSKFMGCRDYEAIKKHLSEADVVLHVESFEEKQILKTKYSFSTKIIDCLQSGSVLLGIGPKEIASIKYIKNIPGAFVADNLECLDESINDFLSNKKSFQERALEIHNFAKTHHDLVKNNEKVKETITKLMGEK